MSLFGLELILYTRLASNSKTLACLCLLCDSIKSVHPHPLPLETSWCLPESVFRKHTGGIGLKCVISNL